MKTLKNIYNLNNKSNKPLLVIGVLLAFLISSCSVKLYEPTMETVTSGADLNELKQGKKLYIDNCAECHSLHKPEKYNPDKWVGIVKVMSEKAKISEEQSNLILRYLTKGQRG